MDTTTYLPEPGTLQAHLVPVQPATDREIITAIQQGDSSAFRYLVEKYESRVFHHCVRMVGNREDSADLTQEVFLKVFRNIHKYEHAYTFYTWLYKITSNCCIDYLRSSKRKIKKVQLSEMDNWDQGESGKDYDRPDETYGPEHTMLNAELREMLNEAVASLSESLRTTILLKEIEGYSYAEIAEISACSIGTVKSRMHRAREELQGSLAPYLCPPPP